MTVFDRVREAAAAVRHLPNDASPSHADTRALREALLELQQFGMTHGFSSTQAELAFRSGARELLDILTSRGAKGVAELVVDPETGDPYLDEMERFT